MSTRLDAEPHPARIPPPALKKSAAGRPPGPRAFSAEVEAGSASKML
jgi:hypothetical protein